MYEARLRFAVTDPVITQNLRIEILQLQDQIRVIHVILFLLHLMSLIIYYCPSFIFIRYRGVAKTINLTNRYLGMKLGTNVVVYSM